jgi:hypothetical protein
MGDRTRLFLTGVAAAGAIAVTVTGNGLWSMIRHSETVEASLPLSQLRDFDGVMLEGPDDVVIVPGDHFAVTAQGNKDALRYLNLYVRRGVLHVGRRRHNGWLGSGNGGITVHVTMPGLTRLWLAGSGDTKLERFEGKELSALLDGSGHLTANNVTAKNVLVTVRGSGSVDMDGKTEALTATVQGSGSMDLDGLAAQTAEIAVQASGSVEAHASRQAKLDIAGSGSAHVSGTTQCQISRNGSGDAECTT